MQDLHRLTQMRNEAREKVVDAAVKVRLYSGQRWSKWSSEQSVTDVPLRRISFLSDLRKWFSTTYIMILVYPNSGICPLELHHSLNASGDMSETWVRWERRALQRWSVSQNMWSSSLTISHTGSHIPHAFTHWTVTLTFSLVDHYTTFASVTITLLNSWGE